MEIDFAIRAVLELKIWVDKNRRS